MQNKTSSTWMFQSDHVHHWAYQNSVFTHEECKKIIELGEAENPSLAQFVADPLDLKIRNSNVSWLYPSQENSWVFQKISDSIEYLNVNFFKFELTGMLEGIQFTRYDSPSGHYDSHIDRVFGGIVRKLSLTIQLSDPADYDGGELHLIRETKPDIAEKTQGRLTIFPSYMLHKVMPVTRGTRYSLVCWVSGPPFK